MTEIVIAYTSSIRIAAVHLLRKVICSAAERGIIGNDWLRFESQKRKSDGKHHFLQHGSDFGKRRQTEIEGYLWWRSVWD